MVHFLAPLLTGLIATCGAQISLSELSKEFGDINIHRMGLIGTPKFSSPACAALTFDPELLDNSFITSGDITLAESSLPWNPNNLKLMLAGPRAVVSHNFNFTWTPSQFLGLYFEVKHPEGPGCSTATVQLVPSGTELDSTLYSIEMSSRLCHGTYDIGMKILYQHDEKYFVETYRNPIRTVFEPSLPHMLGFKLTPDGFLSILIDGDRVGGGELKTAFDPGFRNPKYIENPDFNKDDPSTQRYLPNSSKFDIQSPISAMIKASSVKIAASTESSPIEIDNLFISTHPRDFNKWVSAVIKPTSKVIKRNNQTVTELKRQVYGVQLPTKPYLTPDRLFTFGVLSSGLLAGVIMVIVAPLQRKAKLEHHRKRKNELKRANEIMSQRNLESMGYATDADSTLAPDTSELCSEIAPRRISEDSHNDIHNDIHNSVCTPNIGSASEHDCNEESDESYGLKSEQLSPLM